MSRLTKLVTKPGLFFRDAFKGEQSSPATKTRTTDYRRANPLGAYTMILHSGEGADGVAHLTQWIPAFLQCGVKFVVMTRSPALYRAISEEYPKADIVYLSSATDVDAFIRAHASTLRFVCYPSNTGNNIHLVRHNQLTHVFIGHGDSDKTASAHKVFRMFDEIWTAGQAHRDRFRNAGFDVSSVQFHEVGRPGIQLTLQTEANRSWKERFEANPRILYLPTWEGYFEDQNYASLRITSELIRRTVEQLPLAQFSAKFHPFSGKRIPAYAQMTEGVQQIARAQGIEDRLRAIAPEVNIQDVVPNANLFICDVSAVVTDCLIADCPIFVFVPTDRTIVLAESKMTYKDYAYVFSTVDELLSLIQSVLTEGDYLAPAREQAREYILGITAIREKAFERHIQRLTEGGSAQP